LLDRAPELEAVGGAGAKVTDVEVGVPASSGTGKAAAGGWPPLRSVMGTVSDDVTIMATGFDLGSML
jgi:hypothetical protein